MPEVKETKPTNPYLQGMVCGCLCIFTGAVLAVICIFIAVQFIVK